MKLTNLVLLSILGVFLFSSCKSKLTPFTQQLYDENNWSDDELKRIQFYTSNDIVLFRELTRGESEIISGEIKIKNGRKIDEVVIKKGTPGVLIFRPKEDKFAVSFESGNDDRYLIFGAAKRRGGQYRLFAKDWNRNFGKVAYEGRNYRTSSESQYATLLVDLKRIRDTQVRKRVAKGRTVD
jgi:hypothetical protein